MRIFLTSNGLSTPGLRREFRSLLDGNPKEKKVIVVHSARKASHKKYVKMVGEELGKIGISRSNINYLDITQAINAKNHCDFDVIYMCGGNTFYILDRIRKTGFDKIIRKHLLNGKLYVGVSAGSIILSQSIELAGWGSEADENFIKLHNLRGLNFTNFVLFPHYKDKLRAEIGEFRKKVNYSVENLRDGEAIEIIGDKKRLIK